MKIGIIGGGIHGAAVAYFLTELGDDDIHLFERGQIADRSGSTAYSAGIIRHHYSTEQHIRIVKWGSEFLKNFSEQVGSDPGYIQNGSLRLSQPKYEQTFKKIVALEQKVGIDVDFVPPNELDTYLPAIDSTGVSIAALDKHGGFVDPHLVTTGFSDAARRNGAEIHTKTEVTDIDIAGRTVRNVVSDDERYPVDYLINAAGPWASRIGKMVGVDLPLTLHESKIVVLQSSMPYHLSQPVMTDHSIMPDMYTKPESGGEFILGGIDRPPVELGRSLEGIENEFLAKVMDRIDRRLPGFSDADYINGWSGIITMTPDGHQIVGVPNGLDNFCNFVGGSGHGLKDAPGFAKSIAQDILGKTPRFDLHHYRLERFSADESIPDIDSKTYGY